MDAAQLARNIAEGKGYTTLFIRPFSLYLVQSHNEAKHAARAGDHQLGFRTNQTPPTRTWPIRRCIRWCWPG